MNEGMAFREALHRHTTAIIEREELEGWLSDLSHQIAMRFHILPDGRAFYRQTIEWIKVKREEPPETTAWRRLRQGWGMSEPGRLGQEHMLEEIWQSRVDSGGLSNGKFLSDEQRELLRRAAGDALMERLEQLPERYTLWDRWTDGY